MQKLLMLLIIGALTASCAYTKVERVGYNSDEDGTRIYDHLQMLVVTCQNVQTVPIDDRTRGYSVKFGAVLAKNESGIKFTDGIVAEISAKLDDAGLLALLQAWGEKALDNAKDFKALGATIPGSIPGMEGVWLTEYDANGNFIKLKQINKGAPCPSQAGSGVPAATAGLKPPVKFP